MTIAEIFYIGFLGVILGSFVNAYIWRLSKQLDPEGNKKFLSKKDKQKFSILYSRSICPSCNHKLNTLDLVPVFSWLFLQGKCRYCKQPISVQYPAIELLTGILFFLSAYFWDYGQSWSIVALVTWLITLVCLIALALYDYKHMILPSTIIYKLYLIVAVGLAFQFILGKPFADLTLIILSSVSLGGLFWLLYQLSNGKWIGGGDVRLGFLLGIILGSPINSFLMLFISSLLAILVYYLFLNKQKKKSHLKIPFGPFLISAAIIVILFGQDILDWYISLIL